MDTLDPGPADGCKTHGTRLRGSKYLAIRQVKFSQLLGSSADSKYFSMGCGVFAAKHFVMSCGYYSSVFDDNGTERPSVIVLHASASFIDSNMD
jgi:hypothetical protein